MGEGPFSFPICPFSLLHHALYAVHTGFVFMREYSCQMLKLTAHFQQMALSGMRGCIPLLHNVSQLYFVE